MIYSIGTDVLDLLRIKKIIKRNSRDLLKFAFTNNEIDYCEKQVDSVLHFAARIAAKEAVFKALETGWSGGVGWKDVELVNHFLRNPTIRLDGKAKLIAEERKINTIRANFSYADNMLISVVIFEKE